VQDVIEMGVRMKIDKNEILEYLRALKGEFESKGIENMALFGSFAIGKESVYSDIDIAIKKKSSFLKKMGAYEYFDMINELRSKIERKFHKKVDLFDLDSDSFIKKEIESELIYV